MASVIVDSRDKTYLEREPTNEQGPLWTRQAAKARVYPGPGAAWTVIETWFTGAEGWYLRVQDLPKTILVIGL